MIYPRAMSSSLGEEEKKELHLFCRGRVRESNECLMHSSKLPDGFHNFSNKYTEAERSRCILTFLHHFSLSSAGFGTIWSDVVSVYVNFLLL